MLENIYAKNAIRTTATKKVRNNICNTLEFNILNI